MDDFRNRMRMKEFYFYKEKSVKLISGNCLHKACCKEESVDLIVTSPPYNVDIAYKENDDMLPYEDYLEFCSKWMSNCLYWTKKGGRFCLNIPLTTNKGEIHAIGSDLTQLAIDTGWQYKFTIVWHKNGQIGNRMAVGTWDSAKAPIVLCPCEIIAVFYKGNSWSREEGTSDLTREEFKQWTIGMWEINGEHRTKGHPAPFPKELVKRCIKMFSYVDDLVLDPFAGSGTTLVVAKNLNRKGLGIELSEDYCTIARRRIESETNQLFG